MNSRIGICRTAVWAFVVVAVLTTLSVAQVKTEGLIKGRDGDEILLKTADNPNMVVVLTDDTSVGQLQGMFQARHKEMSMAALIPGLKIKVEGNYNDQKQLVATQVRFTGKDLEQAERVQAGMHETKVQAKKNEAELQKQNAALQAQNEALKAQQEQLVAQQAEIQKHKQEIAAAVARFGQLDDYYIMDEVTVLFGNGKTTVDPKYTPQLLALTEKAKGVKGYMIEVSGHASAVGNKALNQKLSEERANNVTNILLQQGKVPLTRMLAPGAMGESHQVSNDKTKEGQAENRRVVVRVLQNKAVAGVEQGPAGSTTSAK
jgi:OmpA-OmpF porin, OOP family